ncbi:MAG: U32 family peptidase [Christensenellales bacterium]
MCELLCPAGNFEALKAAVHNGADAVYLGGARLNARQSADNFDDAALAEAVRYCHLRGVRVYVTLNTLIMDAEMEEALRFARKTQDIGVDALIVQDSGLAARLREEVPVSLHMSTQAGIHSLPGIRFYENMGCERVILPREMQLEDIAYLCSHTDIKIEVFAHGALCSSFSGQCLLSAMIGGRSGNRGRCAQPCRLPYNGAYALNMKDLCTLLSLDELVDAGVYSFKIEGRLKRSEYVAVTTACYRRALDAVLDGSFGAYKKTQGPLDMHALAQIFNRGGFTKGYYWQAADLCDEERPNNRGIAVGRVEQKESTQAVVKLHGALQKQDAVEFFSKESHGGRVLHQVQALPGGRVRIDATKEASAGDTVYKTADFEQLSRAQESIQKAAPTEKADLALYLQAGERARLVAHAYGLCVTVYGEIVQTAQKSALDAQRAVQQLSKMGGTVFYPGKIDLNMAEDVWIPMRVLNELRRDALHQLSEQQLSKARVVCGIQPVFGKKERMTGARQQKKGELCVQVGKIEQAQAAFAAGADCVYLLPFDYQALSGMLQALQAQRKDDRKLFVNLPPVCMPKDGAVIESLLKENEGRFDGVIAAHVAQITQEFGELRGDYHLNVYNRDAVRLLLEQGMSRVMPSVELTWHAIHGMMEPEDCELYAYGRVAVMNLLHCPFKENICMPCAAHKGVLCDRKGERFLARPVCASHCLVQLLNAHTLDISGKFDRFTRMQGANFRLHFAYEDESTVEAVTRCYRRLMDGGGNGLIQPKSNTGFYFRNLE